VSRRRSLRPRRWQTALRVILRLPRRDSVAHRSVRLARRCTAPACCCVACCCVVHVPGGPRAVEAWSGDTAWQGCAGGWLLWCQCVCRGDLHIPDELSMELQGERLAVRRIARIIARFDVHLCMCVCWNRPSAKHAAHKPRGARHHDRHLWPPVDEGRRAAGCAILQQSQRRRRSYARTLNGAVARGIGRWRRQRLSLSTVVSARNTEHCCSTSTGRCHGDAARHRPRRRDTHV
jgi:hypothetical protein